MGYRLAFFAGLLLGGLAAASAMLFFAPMSGKKMRMRMMHKRMELQDDALDRANEVQESARKLLEKQNKKLTRQASKVRSKAFDRAQDLQERGQKAIKEPRKGLTAFFGSKKKSFERMYR